MTGNNDGYPETRPVPKDVPAHRSDESRPEVLLGPRRVAPDVVLIPCVDQAGAGFRHTNSMVITGREPVIVDTGAPIHRDRWLQDVFSVVEPEDVRWIFISHGDADHVGNLLTTLDLCPAATLVTGTETALRLRHSFEPPPGRTRWIADGGSFDAGDRTLTAVRPPLYDASGTYGLYDDRSGVYWAADCFGALVPSITADAEDLPLTRYLESVRAFGGGMSPWHAWLDPRKFGPSVDVVAALDITAITTAHGPTVTGSRIPQVIDAVRALAGSGA